MSVPPRKVMVKKPVKFALPKKATDAEIVTEEETALPSMKTKVTGRISDNKKNVLHEESSEGNGPAQKFPVNCPRVGATVGIVLSANYQSIKVDAWVELPVPGFTRQLVLDTHERAFKIAEDKAIEKAAGLKEVLSTL